VAGPESQEGTDRMASGAPGEAVAAGPPIPDGQTAAELLGSFVEEARQAVAGMGAALAEVAATGVPAPALERVTLLAHRLRGSAALFGFARIARLAGAMEDRLSAPSDRGELTDPDARGRLFLETATAALARSLDDIAAGGDDAAAALPETAGAATGPDTASQLEADGVAAELRRFAAANPDVLEYFGPEAEEHIEVMAAALAALEDQGPAPEPAAALFRAVHTLKGAAYTVGCGPIARLAHGMEDLLAPLRAGGDAWGDAALPALAEGIEALRLLLAATSAPAGQDDLPGAAPGAADVDARPRAVSLSSVVARALAALGAALPLAAAAAPAAGAATTETGAAAPGAAAAAMAAALGAPLPPALGAPGAGGFRSSIRVSIDRIDRLMSLVGELVISRGRLERRLERLAELEELALARGARMSQAVEEFGARHLYPQLQAEAAAPAASGSDQQETPQGDAAWPSPAMRRSRLATGGAATAAAISRSATTAELFAELEFDRYDDFNLLARRTGEVAADLAELHGEIARLTTLLRDDAGQLQRQVRDLRASIGRARMVPIGQLFTRFGRQVAATAAATGKLVDLELEGEAVEVDTAVAEAIADPLMHLVQNAVIHGIESPEARRARGKPEHGQLLLHAYLQGRFVTVEVEDDGAGIDLAALRREAVARGLRTATAVAALDREETLELVFLRGLSTSTVVTQAAGRGVGMDVVRANLTRLGGEVAIETEAGAGTRITLKAPLTLLISEALMVRVGDETFAIPVTAVRRMVHAEGGEVVAAAGGGEELLTRAGGDERLPLLRLDRLFGLAARRAEPWLPVVVLAAGGRRCALAVDELLGVEEVVIKGLGELLLGLPLFSGAIVTALGRVVLVLDAPAFTLGSAALAAAATEAEAKAAAGEAVPAAPAAAGASAGAAGPAPPAPLRARRLLLVDDSVSVRKAVGQMLGRHGYRVTAVADGEEALEALRQAPFDAVLTDLEMPRLNGYELIEEIRRRPGGRELPIVVITTRAGEKHLEVARRLGATACFGKPFDAAALLSLLGGLAAAAGGEAGA